MPKFVGRRIVGAKKLENNAKRPTGCVRLTYAQATLLPASKIMYSLDTSDKGSKGSYAKRWNRWFALYSDVFACPLSTEAMLERASKAAQKDADATWACGYGRVWRCP